MSVALAVELASCKGRPPAHRPSILLFVLDTTRVDAVSAYGRVVGTTPTVDSLAANGLRYDRAYAQAPWTLPSHATLFTGLLPSQHGVGWGRTRAPDAWVTLAERLRNAGYETVGVSENTWIHPAFNMTRGFERFAAVDMAGDGFPDAVPDVRVEVARWVRERKRDRPFFLFVNVLDAHAPYLVRASNPFLPADVDPESAAAVVQEPQQPGYYFCSRADHERELDILRGLYLGGVAAADAKLRDVLATLRDAGLDGDLATIVTADHGEHLGEHHLVVHVFSVREELLHVPLIVHGLPGVAPAVIDAPVQLADVMPTILHWAGAPVPHGIAGRPLALAPGMVPARRPVIAEQFDLDGDLAPDASPLAAWGWQMSNRARRSCTPEDRVFGDMRVLIRYPLKLIWYANYPARLYDLSIDPAEKHDLAPTRPVVVADLTADLNRRERSRSFAAEELARASAPDVLPPPGVLRQLRALGYLGAEAAQHAREAP